MKKSKIAVMLGTVVLLGAIGVGSTFAYLTSQTDEVVNTFTVGNVKITLDETDVDDSTPDAERDVKNQYLDMIPGETYVKDPVVHVAPGSVESYVYVKIEGLDANQGILSLEGTALGKEWIKADDTEKLDGIYVYAETVDTLKEEKTVDLKPLFEAVTLADNFVSGGTIANIKIEACAVQAGGNIADPLATAKEAAGWD